MCGFSPAFVLPRTISVQSSAALAGCSGRLIHFSTVAAAMRPISAVGVCTVDSPGCKWRLIGKSPNPSKAKRSGTGMFCACACNSAPVARWSFANAEAVMALPGADHWLAPGLSEAMVRFAVRREMARTVEDVLARRSRLLFLDAAAAQAVAPRVADLLVQERACSPSATGLEPFRQLAEQYARVP